MIEVAYNYHDENGILLYQSVRYNPKDFRARRPNPEGGWIYNLEGTRRVPYRLHELLKSAPRGVFVVEGEKDADALWNLGLVATTNVGGAGKWLPEYSEHLAGRDVVILPDNDEPGRRHAQQVFTSLKGVAKSVRTLALPGLPPKGDVSDWIAAGGTKDQLIAMARKRNTVASLVAEMKEHLARANAALHAIEEMNA